MLGLTTHTDDTRRGWGWIYEVKVQNALGRLIAYCRWTRRKVSFETNCRVDRRMKCGWTMRGLLGGSWEQLNMN